MVGGPGLEPGSLSLLESAFPFKPPAHHKIKNGRSVPARVFFKGLIFMVNQIPWPAPFRPKQPKRDLIIDLSLKTQTFYTFSLTLYKNYYNIYIYKLI